MKRAVWIAASLAAALLVRLAAAPGGDVAPTNAEGESAVAAVLDDFHAAAAASDGARYFAHFASEAVFLGTDATERWTLAQFRAFATPLFARGKGWAYRSTSRHVQLAPGGEVAWFDETLDNAAYGACRGSGALRRIGGNWKLTQYNLTIPIPNALASDFVARIRAATPGAPAAAETIVCVVRHADRDAVPGQSDPELNEKGRKRAQSLARMLRSLSLTSIYTTDTRRTRATMAPTAAASALDPVIYDPNDPAALASILRGSPAGSAFLVCGHSNTIPPLLERLGVADAIAISEDEFDHLYVVALSPGRPARLVSLHYGGD